jgi:hypothetical protein
VTGIKLPRTVLAAKRFLTLALAISPGESS